MTETIDFRDLQELLDILRNSESGTGRSAQSVEAKHRVLLAAHELGALLEAARLWVESNQQKRAEG